ncbi:MAG: energy transducer TonB [Candidatus Sulfotelmatobacter sp.]
MASPEANSNNVNPNQLNPSQVNANQVNPNSGGEPELHLLLAPDTFEPLWKSILRQLGDLFFPSKLPPLALESEPEPVKDIWGFYSHKKDGALGSTAVHILIAGIVIAGTVTWTPPRTNPPRKPTVVLVLPADIPALQPGKTLSGGGGGGGDRDVLKASVGRLPTRSLDQITPPAVVLRVEQPRLAVESTIVIPPEVTLVAANHFPDMGDPMAHTTMPSNGQGQYDGIGDKGSRGGIGPGIGPGYGPGNGGGIGGDSYHRGQGASDPSVISQVDPEFSEEARKAKFQGLCVLTIIVEPDGTPSNIRVSGSLGMGLDEKAIEAVRKWRFRPSMKDGHPVRYGPVEVDVDFHLY